MAKKLVIVESPAKAKTINKILGADYVVKASMGHVRDLPVKKLGVDIENGFEPEYVVTEDRKKVAKELMEAASTCSAVYLAPDPDREGEAIAWHLKALLAKAVPEDQFFRVTYNEITPRAVKEAFDHPKHIDQHLVNAQQARRILDRIVGYKVSPLLWSRITRGLSAGRVQSVALRLVCEREALIRGFVPEAFWLFGANVRKQKDPRDPFALRLARIKGEKAEVKTPEMAEEVLKDLEKRSLRVRDIIRRELSRKAFPPYITSSLQQAASRVYDLSPSRTMRIAQKLYEGVDLGDGPTGLITYMRTDSFNLSREAVDDCRQFIGAQYGNAYVPEKPNFFKSRGSAQEAHEAIRPTDVARTPDSMAKHLNAEELKLYTLIWQRFVACQMAPAKIEQRTVEVETTGATGDVPDYLFRATASQVTFPGYMKVTGVPKKTKEKDASEKEGGADEEEEVDQLPPVEKGEALDLLEWLHERKETQPPGRYSEASLVKALEENGVGRPSTYASIIGTLYDRRYVAKEKKSIQPTELGIKVNNLLVTCLNDLFEVKFTASMEELLDEIEQGKVEWTKMLGDFHGRFLQWMEGAKGPAAKIESVQQLLASMEAVTTWGPEVKRGRRIYGDRRFADSIKKQLDEGKKPISLRQLESLGRIAIRYRDQIHELDKALVATGLAALLDEKPPEAPTPAVKQKLTLLKSVTFNAPVERRGRKFDDKAFVESLQHRVDQDRGLSPAQAQVLDRMVVKYAEQIPDFEAIREHLHLGETSQAEDAESAVLLAKLKDVTHWHKTVSKGGKAFDDKTFYDSLAKQYAQRKSLTPRQKSALKRMSRRYGAGAEAAKEQEPATSGADE
jgi:DNA topoisomerase-1